MQLSYQTIPQLKVNGERLRADFEALAQIGETPEGGVTRLALSPEDLQARSWFADRIEEAGLILRDDDAGNLSALLPSRHPGARTLLLGSHLDTVPEGGRYDGAVGVLAALECLRTIAEAEVTLPFHLEAIDFTDDEGCWQSLFGSRAVAGRLTADDVGDARMDNGPFRAALARAGIDPRAVHRARRDPAALVGYLEVHIEQGSRLERGGYNIGVVNGIVGRKTLAVRFLGQAGHSGTTDMYRRRDALRGAALFITRAHDLVRERYGDGVFNCGNIEVKPGAFNIIPSLACLTVEFRHVNKALMHEMETGLTRLARECAASYGLQVEIEKVQSMPAASMDETLQAVIDNACSTLGLMATHLVSYSGHDAQTMAAITPSGMIFIPSVGGVSHHPGEFSSWDDVVNGANVLLHTVLALAQR